MIALPAWPWLDRSVQETGWVKNQVSNDSYVQALIACVILVNKVYRASPVFITYYIDIN